MIHPVMNRFSGHTVKPVTLKVPLFASQPHRPDPAHTHPKDKPLTLKDFNEVMAGHDDSQKLVMAAEISKLPEDDRFGAFIAVMGTHNAELEIVALSQFADLPIECRKPVYMLASTSPDPQVLEALVDQTRHLHHRDQSRMAERLKEIIQHHMATLANAQNRLEDLFFKKKDQETPLG
jgi:hypothetical protein